MPAIPEVEVQSSEQSKKLEIILNDLALNSYDMSQLVLNRGVNHKRQLLQRLLSANDLGPYFLVSSLVFFVALVTVITLSFSTRQVTKGYVLNKLEAEHQTLIKEGEQQQMSISKVRSLKFIEQSSQVQSMIKADEIAFIADSSTALASR